MNVGHYELYDLVDREFKKLLAGYYREGIERCLRMGEKNPYHIGVPFIWCSNNLTVALVTQILLCERMTGDMRYHAFMSAQWDWLLGAESVGDVDVQRRSGRWRLSAGHASADYEANGEGGARRVSGWAGCRNQIFKSLKERVSITEPDPLAAFQDELGGVSRRYP